MPNSELWRIVQRNTPKSPLYVVDELTSQAGKAESCQYSMCNLSSTRKTALMIRHPLGTVSVQKAPVLKENDSLMFINFSD